MTFEQLGLSAPILKALKEQGYASPSPIQENAIPPALAGRDVLGCAQTGTGKTCAFAAPILQRLSNPVGARTIRALILTPTRELAIQIDDSFTAYGKYLPLHHTVIFGGVGQAPQVEALKRGVDILVATPGRLMDLYQQGYVHFDHLEIFVLDEADRMLDMGFIHDVKKILKWLPTKKQTMLFSATMPDEISDLVNSLLRDPARVAVNPVSSPVEAIQQWLCYVDKANKTKLLALLMEQRKAKSALVFTRTKHGANKVARDLVKEGISAAAIHGNKSQTARQQALSEFKEGKLRCLVATDIAARGLDIEELSHVFNYNLPEVPETYVHRIGRTGRAGRGGEAIAFCDFSEKPLLQEIEKLIHRSIPVFEGHPYPMQVFEGPKKDKNGRIINEDDAEARAAARELHRQRDQERQAAAREKRQIEQEKQAQPVQTLEQKQSVSELKNLKRGRNFASKRVPDPVSPTPSAKEPIRKYPGSRSRGIRPGTLMDTGDAMPCTDFVRPNPLDSNVIMDATARLLAPHRTVAALGSSHHLEEKRHSGNQKKTGASKGKPGERQVNPAREHPKPSQRKKSAQPPQSGSVRPAGGKRKSPAQPGGPVEPNQSNHTKDSTEQNSLIKPFYINVGR